MSRKSSSFFKCIFELHVLVVILHFVTLLNAQCTPKIGCADCYSHCASIKKFCGNPIIKARCRKSCDACPETSKVCTALNCMQKCKLSNDGTSAKCDCFNGFELDQDGRNCKDIDECKRFGTTLCQNNSRNSYCKNTAGDYSCTSCTGFGNSTVWGYYKNEKCCIRNTESQCGKSITNGGKVAGGENSRIFRWPWTVYLKSGNELCGGSLITRNHIVTAGHCVEGRGLSELRVLLGVEDTSDGSNVHVQTRSVAQVYIHPNYNHQLLKNDIAIIVLTEPAYLEGDYVSTICLPNGEEPQVDEMCYTVGYGATSFYNRTLPDILQEVNLPIVNDTVCEQSFVGQEENFNSTSQLCAGFSQGGKDTCTGDSGGPLMCQRCNSCDWYLAGVTSYGIGCAKPGHYGVYTKVTHFEEWITRITNQSFSPQACVKETFTQWTEFGFCSAKCDGGIRIRTRSCSRPGLCAPDKYGDILEQILTCNTQPCVGRWGPFSEYGSCSVSCGGGTQSRTRECFNGVVGKGNCIGATTESKPCSTRRCSDTNVNSCNHLTNLFNHTNCCIFARANYCSLYVEYMSNNCRRACCEYDSGLPCSGAKCYNVQRNSVCEKLASFCTYTMVQQYCRATCNVC